MNMCREYRYLFLWRGWLLFPMTSCCRAGRGPASDSYQPRPTTVEAHGASGPPAGGRRRLVAILLVLAVVFVPWCSTIADDLLGGNDLDGWALEDTKSITEADVRTLLSAALAENDAAKRGRDLLAILDTLIENDGIVLQPREKNRFASALLTIDDLARLRTYVPKLLGFQQGIEFDLHARANLEFGVRLSLAVGGAEFGQLRKLLERYPKLLDLEWLLPALARAGGAQALPLLQRHRADNTIIPLGNYQNIRRVPCAAVLACAYAGDETALQMVLGWYEADIKNLPRFAFYVQWARQEGMDTNTSLVLLDYCRHRIDQAERLLQFLAAGRIDRLIARANRELSVSLVGFLLKRMNQAAPEDLMPFVALLDNPSIMVKQQVLTVLERQGAPAVAAAAQGKVRALLASPRGTDRFFAFDILWHATPVANRGVLSAQMKAEPNPAVKRRLKMLRDQHPPHERPGL